MDVPRAEVAARYSARELDLEDELLDAATQTWAPLWKAQRGALPEGWTLLLSQRQPELRELKAMVRRGELTFSTYVQRRDLLRRQVIAGAAPTAVQSGAPRGNSSAALDFLAPHLGTRFKYERELGEGGGGSVSLWTNIHTDAKVAIKVTKPQFKDHISNELRQLEAVRSTAVVHVREYGPIDAHREQWYIVFDYVPGDTLLEFIRREHAVGRLQPDTIMHVLLGIAQGLADLHRAGIVHRDLKPANIILKQTADGMLHPVLIDLGLARSGEHTGQTSIGGTAGYQSPEQQQGEPCSPASDIFCFGLIAYELITGRRMMGGTLKELHASCPGLPNGLDALVKGRCAVEELDQRIQTGGALLEAIRAVHREEPSGDQSPRPRTQSDRAPPPRSSSADPVHLFEEACTAWDECVAAETSHGRRRELAAKALALFDRAAGMGHTESASWLGDLYAEGNAEASVEADHGRALHWLTKAAEGGHAEAMVALGKFYENGRPATPLLSPLRASPQQAFLWYQRAAEARDSGGMYRLGECFYEGSGTLQNYLEAAAWFRKSAEAGDPAGMRWFGTCLFNGQGVTENKTQAFDWFRKSAEAGDPAGMRWFGMCLFNGQGVAENKTQAFDWFRKSVEAGNTDAMCWLGCCHYQGSGTSQSYTEAAAWFRKSAEAGDPAGMCRFGTCLFNGQGVAENKTQAFDWFRKSAEAGNTTGMRRLGHCYQSGVGSIEEDASLAAWWFQKAISAGSAEAQEDLNRLLHSESVQSKKDATLRKFGVVVFILLVVFFKFWLSLLLK